MSRKTLTAAALCAALAMPAAGAAEQPGMVVARDPQTGQLRAPTAAELKALREQGTAGMAGKAVAPPPAAVTRPDGVRQLRLGERGMVYSVVTRDANGKLVQECVHGEQAANEVVKGGVSAAARKQEHSHE